MTTGYIETLSPLEHIRHNKEMYIGASPNPTHLLREIIHNSADEIINGFGDTLEIEEKYNKYLNAYIYCVVDNGRGIPTKSKKMEDKDVVLEIFTTINTGGKFNTGNKLYEFSSGLHGVGAKCVTALSKYLQVKTLSENKDYFVCYDFENGELKNKNTVKKNNNASTIIYFIPDDKYFDNQRCDMDIIKNELLIMKYVLKDKINIIINKQILEDTYEENFVENTTDYITKEYSYKGEVCKLTIAIPNEITAKSNSFDGIVNLIHSSEGVNMKVCIKEFKDKLFALATKQKKHIRRADDVLVPIKMLSFMKLKPKLAFEGQTKDKLAIPKSRLEKLISSTIDLFVKEEPDFVDYILTEAEKYRISLDAKKVKNKTTRTKNTIVVPGLKDSLSKNRDECELFLLEGESAGGTLSQCRDVNVHAILALRGKILNVSKASKSAIMKNEVINNIFMALGYSPFQKIDPDKCRYGAINIVCFTGDTRIKMLDGSCKTFEELVEYETKNPGSEYWLYSKDNNGNVVPGKGFLPRKTGEVNEIIELTLDDGSVFKSTPGHKYITSDGEYIEADRLKIGDGLSPLYHRIDRYGYEEIHSKNKWKKTHMLVKNNMEINENNYVIHHKNKIKTDNNPNNLQYLTISEHAIIHGELTKYNISEKHRKRISYLHKETDTYEHTYFRNNWYNGSEKQKQDVVNYLDKHPEKRLQYSKQLTNYNLSQKHKNTVKKMNADPDQIILQHRGKIYKAICRLIKKNLSITETNFDTWSQNGTVAFKNIFMFFDSDTELKDIVATALKNYDKYDLTYIPVRGYDKNKKAKSSISRIIKNLIELKLKINEKNYNNNRKSKSDPRWENITKYFNSLEECIEESKYYNHKIIKIQKIKLEEKIPVYNITVEKYHNYAIIDPNTNGSVFVKNCDGATRFSIRNTISEKRGFLF